MFGTDVGVFELRRFFFCPLDESRHLRGNVEGAGGARALHLRHFPDLFLQRLTETLDRKADPGEQGRDNPVLLLD